MKKDMPLVERIYVDPLYTELVRLIGYAVSVRLRDASMRA
jgi:hypothetical protein